jgi:hypothetical protein
VLIALVAAVLACGLVAGAYYLYRHYRVHSFFSHALDAAQVAHGISLTEMETSYARELARRDPILGLEGADLSDLSTALERLSHTESALIDMQDAADDKMLADVLYPVDFLNALLKAETARRAFVESGSDTDRLAYDTALGAALRAGEADATTFSAAAHQTLDATSIQIPTLGYAITSERMLQSAADTVAYMRSLGTELARRQACTAGSIGSCDATQLAAPALNAPSSPETIELPQLSKDIYALIAGKPFAARDAQERVIALSSSACTAGAEAPFYFMYRPEMADPIGRYLYLNEAYFTATDLPHSITLAYLRDKLGISYSRMNPMTFYACPEVGYDIGAIRAVAAVADFAAAHPTLDPQGAAALSLPVLSEQNARLYLAHALGNATDAAERNTLISLALQLTRRSSGLPEVVEEISNVEDTDIAFVRASVPFTVRARDLIVGHTAFPSLFMTLYSPWSSVVTSLRLADTRLLNTFLTQAKAYSLLRESVPASKLENDIRAFFEFEGVTQ